MKSLRDRTAGGDARPLQELINAAPITAVQVQAVLLCTLVTFAEGIDLNLIPLLAPQIMKQWSLPSAAFGLIFSAGPLGLIIGGLSIGWLADGIGRRGALIVAMMTMALPTALTGWTASVTELALCRLVTGIGFGGVVPAAAALIAEFLPVRWRASMVAFVILGQSVGGLAAALLMKTRIGTVGWQTLMVAMAAFCMLVTLLMYVALPESPRYLLLSPRRRERLVRTLRRLRLTAEPLPEDSPASARGSAKLAALFTDGRAIGTALLWGSFIGVCAAVSFFTSWLTLIYTYAGQSAAAAVDANAAYWAGGIASGLLLPLFALRWPAERVLMASILGAVAAVVMLGSSLGGTAPLALALPFVCGIFVSGAFYLLYPPAVRFYPTAIRSTGIGAAVAFGRIGNTLSPLAASLCLGAGLAPAGVVTLMALPLLLSAIALAGFQRVLRHQA